MHETIRRYVKSCHVCSRTKASREKYHGLLKPLPVPDRRWAHISVDFVVELPASEGSENIMVVVDRLSKQRHLVSCPDMSAPAVGRLFLDNIWKHHGLPDSIISDRGGSSSLHSGTSSRNNYESRPDFQQPFTLKRTGRPRSQTAAWNNTYERTSITCRTTGVAS